MFRGAIYPRAPSLVIVFLNVHHEKYGCLSTDIREPTTEQSSPHCKFITGYQPAPGQEPAELFLSYPRNRRRSKTDAVPSGLRLVFIGIRKRCTTK